MRFNNFLNRLRLGRIYLLIAAVLVIALAFVILVISTFLHVAPPEQVFEDYVRALRSGHYNEAVRYIVPSEQDAWQAKFKAMAQDDSAESSLRVIFWSEASWELVSQSTLADDYAALRYQLTTPDAAKILRDVRKDAEKGVIDMSDPDVVRVAKDAPSTLLYYVEDNLEKYRGIRRQAPVIVNFRLGGGFLTKKWYIEPNDELLKLLSGDLSQAVKDVFRAPLNLPKR